MVNRRHHQWLLFFHFPFLNLIFYLCLLSFFISRGSSDKVLLKEDNEHIVLQNGKSTEGGVGAEEYQYFSFTLTQKDVDLTFSLTALSGDPDLFIGIGDEEKEEIKNPTKESYTYSAKGFGSDSLSVQANQLAEHCVKPIEDNTPCNIYIGVYGWIDSTYTILVNLNQGWSDPIELELGTPQQGLVETGGWTYYKVEVDVGNTETEHNKNVKPDIIISLTPTSDSSDQDLYITFDGQKQPGKKTYDLRSTNWNQNDIITITSSNEFYCNNKCTIYIGVYGFSGGEFSISVTLSTQVQELQMGIPVMATVNSEEYIFYSTTWNSIINDVLVSVSMQSGDIYLYASCKEEYPDASHFNEGSTGNIDSVGKVIRYNSQYSSIFRLNITEANTFDCELPSKLYLSAQVSISR